MSRLFISVERLEAWTAEGRAALEGDRMTLTELGRKFAMTPAVHFVQSDRAGPRSARSRRAREVEGRARVMGAEQFANSVIYNDTAYDVVDGFIGEPLPP